MAGRLRFVPLVVFGVVLLVVYSALNRPLLYDEYVYFALGGLPSTVSVLEAIHSTTTNVNQGVTGAYMLAGLLHW